VSRCVPVSHGSAPDIGGRAPVLAGVSKASHGSRMENPRFYTEAFKKQDNLLWILLTETRQKGTSESGVIWVMK